MNTMIQIKDRLNYYARNNMVLWKEIKKLQRLDDLDEDVQIQMKNEKAARLVKFAAQHSSFYKNLYAQVNLSQDFSNYFSSLPMINRDDVHNNSSKISTVWTSLLKKANTSGTSGTPLTVYRSLHSIIREQAYIWHFRMSHGLNFGDRVVSLRGKLNGDTLHYYNKAENVLYLSSYLLSPGNIKKYAKLLTEFKPVAICAYPSTAYSMTNLLSEAGYFIKIPLIFTSSENLYAFQKAKIQQTFQGKIVESYGNVERSIHYGHCKYGMYHEYNMYSLNEFGENGIVTTSLINDSFPLIRYFVNDNVTLISSPCKCGKKYGIQSVDGRYDEVIILDDGTRITALSLAFYGIKNLKYSQIIQHEIGKIILNIVPLPTFSDADEAKLLLQLNQRMHNRIKIEVNRIAENELIKAASGKYQLVVSDANVYQ